MDRRQLVENIKAQTDIVEIVGRYVKLTRAGNNFKGLCPFHQEATPSFLVSPSKGIYKCFGCGEGGDAISFLSKMENVSYQQSLYQLAQATNVDEKQLSALKVMQPTNQFNQFYEMLNFARGFFQYYLLNSEEGQEALKYLLARRIDKETIERFQIGLAPRDSQLLITALTTNQFSLEKAKEVGLLSQNDKGDYYCPFRSRILFSVNDESGKCVGFSGRRYLPGDDGYAKYINSIESPVFQKNRIIYNIKEAKNIARQTSTIFIFEGFLDVIAATTAGIEAAVATMGTALTTNHVQIIKSFAQTVYLVFDGDKAGIAATVKAIPLLYAQGLQVKIVRLPVGVDPDDFIGQQGKEAFLELVRHALGALQFMYDYAKIGLDLTTPDGEVEYERRLEKIGNQFNVGSQLLWKFRNEEKKKKSRSAAAGAGQTVGSALLQPVRMPVSRETKAEKQLIYYMLLDKDVFTLVNATLGTAFNIDAHRKIVLAIEDYYYKFDEMDKEQFLSTLDHDSLHLVREIEQSMATLPQTWTKELIVNLVEIIKKAAEKLTRDGKKAMIFNASHEELLVMINELTT